MLYTRLVIAACLQAFLLPERLQQRHPGFPIFNASASRPGIFQRVRIVRATPRELYVAGPSHEYHGRTQRTEDGRFVCLYTLMLKVLGRTNGPRRLARRRKDSRSARTSVSLAPPTQLPARVMRPRRGDYVRWRADGIRNGSRERTQCCPVTSTSQEVDFAQAMVEVLNSSWRDSDKRRHMAACADSRGERFEWLEREGEEAK